MVEAFDGWDLFDLTTMLCLRCAKTMDTRHKCGTYKQEKGEERRGGGGKGRNQTSL